ncbi:MAG: PilZ domain-containing protein [Proteobacteria bacterium]|jgi:hypothetical protein|nr:PilZ domain-containing protein [Pseudomonadota bacterium]
MIEERADKRFEGRSYTIFVEVESAAYDGSTDGNIVICKSINLSAEGLQVVVDTLIPARKVLRLCLDVRDEPPIFVVGEVMWQRQEPETGEYHVGFRLFDSEETDYQTWRQMVAELIRGSE